MAAATTAILSLYVKYRLSVAIDEISSSVEDTVNLSLGAVSGVILHLSELMESLCSYVLCLVALYASWKFKVWVSSPLGIAV